MGTIKNFRKRHCHNFLYRLLSRLGKKINFTYENRNYDSHTNGENRVLEKLSQKDIRTIFDVGANIGSWTTDVLKIFPKHSNVYAFEVIPNTYDLLKAMECDRVKTFCLGLSSETKSSQIFSYSNSHELASLHEYREHEEEPKKIDVNLVKGDEFLNRIKSDGIDFLKIDTEGHDLEVLKGFEDTIGRKRIRVIQFEYGRINIVSKALLVDFYTFFKRHGYVVGKIYPLSVDFREYKFEHEDFIGPNYLAVHRDDHEIIRLLS